MSKRKTSQFIYIITVGVICSVIFSILIAYIFRDKQNDLTITCVPTETEAIAICEVICTKAYPDLNLEQYKLEYLDDGDTWIVFYSQEGMLGGGLPEVHIRKDNAQVTFIALMA